ncbi:MAG: type II secretion system F family protein [Armatimonadetes bacterium]|nr:type II secretion system F family protein [Armatimonadota bacterium]
MPEPLSPQQQATFFRRWHTLENGGLTTHAAMDVIVRHPAMRGIERPARALRDMGLEGKTPSQAMERLGKTFSGLHIGMIRAAEQSGSLPQALGLLAGFAERELELRRSVQWATFHMKVTILVFVLVALFVRAELWYLNILKWIALGALAFWGFLWVLRRSREGLDIIETAALRLPLFAKGNRLAATAKFLWGLSMLYKSGIGLSSAIELSADSCGNADLARRIRKAAPSVLTGRSLADCLKETGALDPETLGVVAVSEVSGDLDTSLDRLAEHYDRISKIELDKAYTLFVWMIWIIVAVLIGIWILLVHAGRMGALFSPINLP